MVEKETKSLRSVDMVEWRHRKDRRPTEAGFQRRDTRAHHSPRTRGLLW